MDVTVSHLSGKVANIAYALCHENNVPKQVYCYSTIALHSLSPRVHLIGQTGWIYQWGCNKMALLALFMLTE